MGSEATPCFTDSSQKWRNRKTESLDRRSQRTPQRDDLIQPCSEPCG